MTDPIADFLARINNGILGRKASIQVPPSSLKRRLAELLWREGYLSGVGDGEDGKMLVTLRWDAQNQPAITGLRRVSKPGQRSYVPADAIPRVRGGIGTVVVSTSKGIMTDRDARKEGVGGEVLCEVW